MEIKRVIRIVVFTFIILALLLLLPKGPVQIDSGRRMIMGTFARIIVVAGQKKAAQKAIEAALAALENIEQIANIHSQDSEVSKVNSLAGKQPVKISNELYEIIQTAVNYGRLTNGAFDITVEPLEEFWQQAAETNQAPQLQQFQDVRQKVGFDKIILDPVDKSIRFTTEGVKIDLGGIAKGYAIDKAVEAVKAAGAIGVMVDVGGDIRCFGIPSDGRDDWLIGLQDPAVEQQNSILTLKIRDAAVATSGDYRRFTLIGDQKYSHIIDAHTGKSAHELSSSSIITGNCVDADALATAVSVLGVEDGLKLIESLDNTEGIVVSPAPDYEITATTGAEKYLLESHTEFQIYNRE